MSKTHVPTRDSPAYLELQKQLASLDVLSVTQSAVYLNVSEHTIYKLISQQAFKFSKPIRKIYVQRSALDEWRNTNSVSKKNEAKKISKYFLNK